MQLANGYIGLISLFEKKKIALFVEYWQNEFWKNMFNLTVYWQKVFDKYVYSDRSVIIGDELLTNLCVYIMEAVFHIYSTNV